MSEIIQVVPPSRPNRCLPEVALIGSRSSFSDMLLRATGKALGEVKLVHVPSIEAFNELPRDQTCWLRLLLIDEITLRIASDDVIGSLRCPPTMSVAVAFLDSRFAADLYSSKSKALPIDSYVPLNVRLDLWLSIIGLLLHGGTYVPPELMSDHRGRRGAEGRSSGKALTLGLTPRQYSVLELVAAGLPNKVIASRLSLSDHTVKLHIHNVIAKLGVTNRTEAAARYRNGAP